MSDSALAAVTDPEVTALPLSALAPPAVGLALEPSLARPALGPPTTRDGGPSPGELVLDRAFRILTAFGPDHHALSLTALARSAERVLHRAAGPEPTETTS
jgi:hypothetical protein